MRLAKYLAHAGVGSRRASERLIATGRVTVDGVPVTDPARDVDAGHRITVDGAEVTPEPREVWMVHKPVGVVSTAREPGDRPAVVELVRSPRRLYPVGRLDVDASGLLLLTNDGELANRLTHPRYEVAKRYRVRLRRPVGATALARLRTGVELDDGPTRPAQARRVGDRELELVLREGRNRQVKRMAEAMGNRVVALRRVGFGPLALGALAPGRARRLSPQELERLWQDARPMGTRAADARR